MSILKDPGPVGGAPVGGAGGLEFKNQKNNFLCVMQRNLCSLRTVDYFKKMYRSVFAKAWISLSILFF